MMDGFQFFPGYLDVEEQAMLRDALRDCLRVAPLYRPEMPRTGAPFSVRMSNAGCLGWVADRTGGYRYQPNHPVTGEPWPAIPEIALRVWRDVSGYGADPEACLINWYDAEARMGLHTDSDEAAKDAPVVSLSLGDTALFRIETGEEKPKTRSMKLSSGDVVVLGGASRQARHGIDRIQAGSSTLLGAPGRINVTLRRVTLPETG